MHTGPDILPSSAATHDLAVCLRIYPGLSGKPALGFTAKFTMVRASMLSYRAAMEGVKVKIWLLLDKCPPSYAELATEIFSRQDLEILPLPGVGNEATFGRQIQILSEQTSADLVYFAEDDYLHLPGALTEAVAFLKEHPKADFLTLYDHADYRTKYIHQRQRRECATGSRRWHTVASTCLTFMARRITLSEALPVLQTYSQKNSDLALWMALTKTGVFSPWSAVRSLRDGLFFPASHVLAWRHCWRQILFGRPRTLWVPRPSLATHLESTGLAAGVDWEKYKRELAAKSGPVG